MEAQTIRGTPTSFRSRRPVEGDLIWQAPRGGRHRSFDGKDRECPGQSAMAESFIATLKTELVHRRRFPDREVARSAIFEYLEAFYNPSS
jgi:transposase InsO family protein